ncbi:MAG: phosphoglycerate dehydrogenase [Eubacterium sp.]|nr:phosphoglycerate dehydrogenase [Eubacterium sp.]MDE6155148.1 phosphoglycerate dehydrogenase [Eubacterium sp.]
MFNIKTLNKISDVGLSKFDADKYICANEIDNPDAIMVRSASMHDMEMPESLLAIARAGAGVNNIPVADCAQQGIVVFNTPGANANAVKELVICGLLLSSRKITKAIEWCKTIKDEGDNVGKAVEKGKSAFAGPEIKGKTLGVIGLGAIGRLVAEAAVDLGMNVIGYDPFLPADAQLKPGITLNNNLDEIFPVADYLTLHVPLTPETKGLICADTIATMKDTVRIMNFARGDLAVSGDIVDALEDGKMAAYVTDFPSADLIGVDGVIAMPHLGASTPESEENCASMGALELIDFLENGNIKNSVNMPAVSVARTGVARITVIHKNQPNMIATITDTISKDGINISAFEDKNRGEWAYSIIDTDSDFAQKVVDDITAIDGVIRVRVIRQ